jgi:ryanodine receptor 2
VETALNNVLLILGGRGTAAMEGMTEPYIRKGDVIGVALDLTVPCITFTFNGNQVKGSFRDFNLDGMFFPVISCSSKLRLIFLYRPTVSLKAKMIFIPF